MDVNACTVNHNMDGGYWEGNRYSGSDQERHVLVFDKEGHIVDNETRGINSTNGEVCGSCNPGALCRYHKFSKKKVKKGMTSEEKEALESKEKEMVYKQFEEEFRARNGERRKPFTVENDVEEEIEFVAPGKTYTNTESYGAFEEKQTAKGTTNTGSMPSPKHQSSKRPYEDLKQRTADIFDGKKAKQYMFKEAQDAEDAYNSLTMLQEVNDHLFEKLCSLETQKAALRKEIEDIVNRMETSTDANSFQKACVDLEQKLKAELRDEFIQARTNAENRKEEIKAYARSNMIEFDEISEQWEQGKISKAEFASLFRKLSSLRI